MTSGELVTAISSHNTAQRERRLEATGGPIAHESRAGRVHADSGVDPVGVPDPWRQGHSEVA